MEQIAVGPFEIKHLCECRTYCTILELVAPGVEHHAVHSRRQARLERIFLDLSIGHRRKVVAAGPTPRIAFDMNVDQAFLEGFEHGVLIAEVADADFIVVIESAFGRVVLCPVIGVTFQADQFAGLDFLENVGAGTNHRFKGGSVEIVKIRVLLRKDRQKAEK